MGSTFSMPLEKHFGFCKHTHPLAESPSSRLVRKEVEAKRSLEDHARLGFKNSSIMGTGNVTAHKSILCLYMCVHVCLRVYVKNKQLEIYSLNKF